VTRCQARPAAQLGRAGEPADVADLSHDDRGQHRADTRQRLDGAVTVVAGQQIGDHRVQQGDLAAQLGDQLAQRGDLARIRLRQGQPIEPRVPPHAEDIGAGDRHAQLGEHRVHLVLAAAAALHQLEPVPRQLPQLTDLRRGDPRLRQPPHPQQVRQVSGVLLVVLHTAVSECLDPQRVGQVHLRPGGLEHIGGPVPPIRRFQDHPRVRPSHGDRLAQLRRAVGDPGRAQPAPVLGHPHQHTAAPVQVHPDDLTAVIRCLHWGLPIPGGDGCLATSSIRQGAGGSAPSSHQRPDRQEAVRPLDRLSAVRPRDPASERGTSRPGRRGSQVLVAGCCRQAAALTSPARRLADASIRGGDRRAAR